MLIVSYVSTAFGGDAAAPEVFDRIGTMRVAIVIESSVPTSWSGNFVVNGLFANSIRFNNFDWFRIDQNVLYFAEREPKRFTGCQVTIDVQPNTIQPAEIKLCLTNNHRQYRNEPPINEVIPLESFTKPSSVYKKQLDSDGSVITIQRVNDDELPVRLHKVNGTDSNIFAPNQPIHLDVFPRLIDIPFKSGMRVRVGMAFNDDGIYTPQTTLDEKLPCVEVALPESFANNPTHQIPVSFTLPDREGSYSLIVELLQPHANSLLPPYVKRSPAVAARSLPLVIVDTVKTERYVLPSVSNSGGNVSSNDLWCELLKHPAAQHHQSRPNPFSVLQQRMKLPPLPTLQMPTLQLPRRNDNSFEQNETQPFVVIPARNDVVTSNNVNKEQMSFSRIPLVNGDANNSMSKLSESFALSLIANTPYLIEIDYPTDREQRFEVQIVTTNNNGEDIKTAEVVDVNSETAAMSQLQTARKTRCYRKIFWSSDNTKTIVNLTNLRPVRDAVYGEIRVSRIAENFPSAFDSTTAERNFFAAFDNIETLYNRFGFTLSDQDRSEFALAKRLTDYLLLCGYNGAALPVLDAGQTLYPNYAIEPAMSNVNRKHEQRPSTTPDVTETIMRNFDREGLKFAAVFDFSAPIAELETLRMKLGNNNSLGWIAPDGTELQPEFDTSVNNTAVSGCCPYYNILNPDVREAIHNIIRQFNKRYNAHPSFVGCVLRLSPNGYLQLPEPQYGMDDVTIARFQLDTGIELPAGITNNSPDRFARRWEAIRKNHYEAWLQWRAFVVTKFYMALRDEILMDKNFAMPYSRDNSPRMLCIDASGLLEPPSSASERLTASQLMQLRGFIPSMFADKNSIHFVKPTQNIAGKDFTQFAAALELEQSDLDATFNKLAPYSIKFVNNHGTATATDSGEYSRKRFVRSMIDDDVEMFLDNVGQEESSRELIAAFRCLPNVKFDTWQPKQETDANAATQPSVPTLQPLTIRHAKVTTNKGINEEWYCLLNSTPVEVNASLSFNCKNGITLTEPTGIRNIATAAAKNGTLQTNIVMKPFDMIVLKASDSVTLLNVTTEPSAALSTFETVTRTKIANLNSRVGAAWKGVEYNVIYNAGFDVLSNPQATGALNGWQVVPDTTTVFNLNTQQPTAGNGCLSINQTNMTPAGIWSQPFVPPKTGRLYVVVQIDTTNTDETFLLQAVLTGSPNNKSSNNKPFTRAVDIAPLLQTAKHNQPSTKWQRVIIPFDMLPTEELSTLRLGFVTNGKVVCRLDNIVTYNTLMTVNERNEMMRSLYAAEKNLSTGKLAEVTKLFDRQSSQFLLTHIAQQQNQQTTKALITPPITKNKNQPKSKEKEPTTNILDRLKFWSTK
jgi:hypothetical protein